MKIIVVDDERAALSTFMFHLVDNAKIEYQMFLNKPMQALEYAKANSVDAAFLDIVMPEINGVDLAEKLIAVHQNIKIVFTSGYAQNEEEIAERIGSNLVGYCYKPYDRDLLYRYLQEIGDFLAQKREVSIRTFGAFDVFINDELIKFNSAKSKELLALLVDKNGACVEMNSALNCMWPDHNLEHSKRLYRDAVYRLRMVLRENDLLALVNFERARLSVNKQFAKCDYWDFLSGGTAECAETYLPNFTWAINTQFKLEILQQRRLGLTDAI